MNLSNHSFTPQWMPVGGKAFRPIGMVDGIGHLIYAAIRDQLPEGVARRVAVTIKTDPYYLATRAAFTSEDGRVWDVLLEPMLVGGKWASALVPREFIAHLCVAL